MRWTDKFQFATADYLSDHFTAREGERRIGQRIQYSRAGAPWEECQDSSASYVLLGIPEDIGVRANLGQAGAASLWKPSLRAFLQRQSTPWLDGSNLFLLGHLHTQPWMEAAAQQDLAGLRDLVAEMDPWVVEMTEAVIGIGKTPLVVGGGHNQAYGLIRGASQQRMSAIDVLNMDAHADYRAMEGRHSGNGFRYAREEGFLDRYAILGLSRGYNAAEMVAELSADPRSFIRFYEDLFLSGSDRFNQELEAALNFLGRGEAGIELDMDALDGVPSSAMAWGGFSVREARQYVRRAAKGLKPLYFHLTEGAVQMEGRPDEPMVAKLAAQLLADFLEAAAPNSRF